MIRYSIDKVFSLKQVSTNPGSGNWRHMEQEAARLPFSVHALRNSEQHSLEKDITQRTQDRLCGGARPHAIYFSFLNTGRQDDVT